MFNFLKRGRAASQVKQYTAHWCAAMSTSFKAATVGYSTNEKGLELINCSVIIAALMFRNLSSPRLMTAIADQISHAYGFTMHEFQTCALTAKAILYGFDGEDVYETQLSLLKEVCPDYPFTLADTEWFKTNINIIIEVMQTSLKESITIMSN